MGMLYFLAGFSLGGLIWASAYEPHKVFELTAYFITMASIIIVAHIVLDRPEAP